MSTYSKSEKVNSCMLYAAFVVSHFGQIICFSRKNDQDTSWCGCINKEDTTNILKKHSDKTYMCTSRILNSCNYMSVSPLHPRYPEYQLIMAGIQSISLFWTEIQNTN